MDPDVLLERARQGDRSAFGGLYRRNYPRVVRRLMYLIGPDCAVLDLVQETFLRAYRGLGRYRGEASFSTWVLGIATNMARTHYRRRRSSIWRLWRRPEEEARVEYTISPVDETYPHLAAVHQALGQLSLGLREAVILFELEELSLKEVAATLDIPINTAASRVRRGRRRLRQALERMGFSPTPGAVALCNGEPR